MERPLRKDFAERADYQKALRDYVDSILGNRDPHKATLESLKARLEAIELLLRPANQTLGEKVSRYAANLITDRYSLTDQANITRKAARAAPSRQELVDLEEMDNFIEAILDAHDVHQKAIEALDSEDAAAAYDVTAGWPKEA